MGHSHQGGEQEVVFEESVSNKKIIIQSKLSNGSSTDPFRLQEAVEGNE